MADRRPGPLDRIIELDPSPSDSEKAIKSASVTSKITHVATGGASLEFLAGIELPGVEALTKKAVAAK